MYHSSRFPAMGFLPGRPLAGFFLLHLKVIFPRLNLQRVFFTNICFFYFAKYNYGDIIIDAYMHMPGVPVLVIFGKVKYSSRRRVFSANM